MFDFDEGRYWVDFDGVLVDSNEIKEKAFYALSQSRFGDQAATQLVNFHRENPGLSRFAKIDYLFEMNAEKPTDEARDNALAEFSKLTRASILATNRSRLVKDYFGPERPNARILSAAPTVELQDLCSEFDWSRAFRNRIYGSPTTKSGHLGEKRMGGNTTREVLIGDSPSDFAVAKDFGLQFVFIYGWTSWRPSHKDEQQFLDVQESFDAFLTNRLKPLH